MKRLLGVMALVLFVGTWAAASWLGGQLYACEPPTCQLWPEGPILVAAIVTLLAVAIVATLLRARRQTPHQ
jgi:hypothetical protein